MKIFVDNIEVTEEEFRQIVDTTDKIVELWEIKDNNWYFELNEYGDY